MSMGDWRRGEVAVLGLARSGDSVTRLLRKEHVRVYASDAADTAETRVVAEALRGLGASADAGRHDLQRIAAASLVVTSPGIPPDAPPLRAAREARVPVVSEMEVGLGSLPRLKYLAITGTNGKSTVTHVATHLLRSLGASVAAAGNIGRPVSDLALQAVPPEWAVLECSSFQLHDTPGMRPVVGVLTNLAPDHLDRYGGSVEAYYDDKALLFRHDSAAARWVVNFDDQHAREMTRPLHGLVARFSASGRLCDAFLDRRRAMLIVLDAPLVGRGAIPLLGAHNIANALAATLAVMLADPAFRTLQARERIAAGLGTVRPLAHRLEIVGEFGGVLWINDSKATNVAAAAVAIASMTRPTVLLLGGRGKGESYGALAAGIRTHCRAVIVYGEAGDAIRRDLDGAGPMITVAGDFHDVLQRARAEAHDGDAVLLAPANTSWDMFRNYEERGRAFADFAQGEEY